MITSSDIKKLKEVFTTKAELGKTIEQLMEFIQSFQESMHNENVAFKDEIIHEIVASREEMTIVKGHRDLIEDHGTRIEKLEDKVFTTTTSS